MIFNSKTLSIFLSLMIKKPPKSFKKTNISTKDLHHVIETSVTSSNNHGVTSSNNHCAASSVPFNLFLVSEPSDMSLFTEPSEISLLFTEPSEVSLFTEPSEISLFNVPPKISLPTHPSEISLFTDHLELSVLLSIDRSIDNSIKQNEPFVKLFSNQNNIIYTSVNGYIIAMQLCADSMTNMDRKVVNKNFAKYRCDKARVLWIRNKNTNKEVNDTQDQMHKYVKNEIVVDPGYNGIQFNGIQFFLEKRAAIFHDKLPINYTGIYETWDDDGKLKKRCDYIHGKNHGVWEEMHENGKIQTKCNYVNGKIHGTYTEYHDNGYMRTKCNYENGKIHGVHENMYRNGKLRTKCTYVDGKIHGVYEHMHKNGQIFIKRVYKQGIPHGEHE